MAESRCHYARRFVLCVVELSLIGGVGFEPGFFQALLASRAAVGSVRKDEHDFLAHSAEKARLMERISTLEKENEALENLRGSLTSENELLKGRVSEQEETISKMQEKISLDEGVLENLRSVVEKDAANVVNLQTEVRQLKADVKRKNVKISELEKEVEEDRVMWESASQDILNKSAAIRENTARLWRLSVLSPRLSRRTLKVARQGCSIGC